MYVAAPEQYAMKLRDIEADPSSPPVALVQCERLRRPNTLADGTNGAIYVTISLVQDPTFFKPDAQASLPTQLWRMES